MLKIESETICLFNDEEEMMCVSTFNKKWKKDLLKIAEERADECEIISRGEGDEEECKVNIPKSWLKIKPSKVLSEEEREKMRQRALALHEKKKKKMDGGLE